MFEYKGLDKLLKNKNIKKSDLTNILGISSKTIAKISKGERLSRITIEKLCTFFSCNPEDLYKEISNNHILQILKDEKSTKISGGLYHELQIRMTYNSNHIEGSKLTEDQTRYIFETNTLNVGDNIPVDDILETVHHFRAIDYVIDKANDILSEDIIKMLHYILKHDTKDSTLEYFNVGDYKLKPNMVGGRETTHPKNVEKEMKSLLTNYNNLKNVNIEDIIEFHLNFERIHPFQDGNGRVGRLIALKECLRFNIIPFIIEDSKKMYYYRGLKEWDNEKGYLIDTCLDGQDSFIKLLNIFEIPYNN